MTRVLAADLQPGDVVDLPAKFTRGTDNEQIQPYEYAVIESVNGGWADGMLHGHPDHVILYVPNWTVPVMVPAGYRANVVERGK
jgi:hypothetical protein